MEDDDVVGAYLRLERFRARTQGGLVGGALGVSERAAVACESVQSIVDALGHLEELGRRVDHLPTGVDAGVSRIRE